MSRWEFTAKYNLAASDAETMQVPELLGLADDHERAEWEHLSLGYTETLGNLALRETIAHMYSGLSPQDILCFSGAEEGIFVAMHAILSSDDHAVVVTPTYQALESIPTQLCQVSGIALRAEDHWNLDLDELEQAITPSTRLIVLTLPNNPTGKILDRASYDALVELAHKRNIFVFCDEVYRGLERDAGRALPQIAETYDSGLSLGVMSKAYGLPGLRIGWVATRNRPLLDRMNRLKHYLSICNSAPSEVLARIALKSRSQILERNRKLVAANLELCDDFFSKHSDLFDWYASDGGCVAFPEYRGPGDAESFCRTLLEQAGILLLPPSIFASTLTPTPPNRFRIGFGRRATAVMLERLDEYVEQRF